MNGTFGSVGLLIGSVAALVSIVASAYGWRRSSSSAMAQARAFAILCGVGVLISVVAMERALLTHDFSLAYVAQNNSLETPTLFTITGMWSALQGSILLWAAIQALNVAVLIFVTRKRRFENSSNVAILTATVILGFFVVMMLGPANPFVHVTGTIPVDGQGPNPLLQNYPLVAVHPPLLYSGFVSLSIPFSLWIGDRFARPKSAYFRELARRWAVLSFSLLTLGIALGAWWSYQVLGWGGFWAWDPVENAALMPWIFTVAYIHSAYLARRRPSADLWSFSAIAGAFCFTILGTYFTRSGVLQSVHAFSSSTLGPILISFFIACSVLSIYVALTRFGGPRVDLKEQKGPRSLLSKVGLLRLNAVIFVALVFVILLGTVFPLITQAINGGTVTVGAPYFNSFVAPIGALLIVMMAAAPVLSWRGSPLGEFALRMLIPGMAAAAVALVFALSGVHRPGLVAIFSLATFSAVATMQTYLRSLAPGSGAILSLGRRQSGGLISHLGVLMVALALASATSFGHKTELKLNPGQSASFYGETITYLGPRTHVTPAQTSLEAAVTINGQGPFYPAVSQFGTYTQPIGSPAVSAHLTKDIYLTLDQPPTKVSSPVLIGVIIQPMIDWLWIGAAVTALGGFLSIAGMRPSRRRQKRSEASKGGQDGNAPDRNATGGEVPMAVH